MMDMRKVELRIVSDCDSYPVELPDNVGLMLNATAGQPMRVLEGLIGNLDGTFDSRYLVPCPIRLSVGDELRIFHEGLLAAVFVEHRGIAVDPMTLIGPDSPRAKRKT